MEYSESTAVAEERCECLPKDWINSLPGLFRFKKPLTTEEESQVFLGYMVQFTDHNWVEIINLNTRQTYHFDLSSIQTFKTLFSPILCGIPIPAPCLHACE